MPPRKVAGAAKTRSALKARQRTTTRKGPPAKRGPGAILKREDVRSMLMELARCIAPADVAELLAHETELRRRDWQLDRDHLPVLRDQLDLSLECLRDHVQGACPQIPFFTIALLAAAVCYFGDELDFIPDFLPRIGRLDDAVVMAMAFELGEDGLRRYAAAKGRPVEGLIHPVAAHAR